MNKYRNAAIVILITITLSSINASQLRSHQNTTIRENSVSNHTTVDDITNFPKLNLTFHRLTSKKYSTPQARNHAITYLIFIIHVIISVDIGSISFL